MINNQHTIKCMSWNAQGLHGKINELRNFLSHDDFDVILIQETNFHKNKNYVIPNYTLHRSDTIRPSRRGGTAVYIKSGISHRRADIHTPNLDSTAIYIHTPHGDVLVASIHISPHLPFPRKDFDSLISNSPTSILAGDYNARHYAWNGTRNCPRGTGLLKFLFDKGARLSFPPDPTHFYTSRLGTQGSTTIDLLVYTNIKKHIPTGTLNQFTSDHHPVYFDIPIDVSISMKCSTKTDWMKYTNLLSDIPLALNTLDSVSDIEQAAQSITDTLSNAYKQATTSVTVSGVGRLPLHIRKLISQRNSARKRYQNTLHPTDRSTYNRLKAQVKRAISTYTQSNWQDYLESLTPSDGSIWRAIAKLNHKKTSLPPIKHNGAYHFQDKDKANIIANCYTTQFSNTTLTNNDWDRAITNATSSFLSQNPTQPITPTIPTEIVTVIQSLQERKCPGKDSITNRMLKCIPTNTLFEITHLTNAILHKNYFPECWKVAIICPIPKPGLDLAAPDSYRPISLLSALSKVIERIILNRLKSHIIAHDLLLPEQFGFRECHSTTQQLLRVTEHIHDAIQNKEHAAILLLDLKKAFDKVWHRGLLYKLIHYYFPDSLIHLVNSYLTNRTYQVRVDSALSDPCPIQSGVPQGSILGPTLFNLYINDLPRARGTELALFADDTAILCHNRNKNILHKQMQRHIDLIEDWMSKWHLELNPNKCQAISFTRKLPPSRLIILNHTVEWENTAKYLGVILDKNLTWKRHISHVRSKMQTAFQKISKLIFNRKINCKNKTILYKAFVRPIATYAAPVWASAAKTNLSLVESKQNYFLRLIRNGPTFINNNAIRRDLKVKTIRKEFHKQLKTFYTSLDKLPNTIVADFPDYDYRDPSNIKRPKAALHTLPCFTE